MFLDEVLECGDDHDEDLWPLVRHQLEELGNEGGPGRVLQQLVF